MMMQLVLVASLLADVAVAVLVSGVALEAGPIETEPDLQAAGQPTIVRKDPHRLLAMDESGQLGALIESGATVAISSRQQEVPATGNIVYNIYNSGPQAATCSYTFSDRSCTGDEHCGVGCTCGGRFCNQAPVVSTIVQAQQPGVGQAVAPFTQAQSPSVGQPAAKSIEAQSPGTPIGQTFAKLDEKVPPTIQNDEESPTLKTDETAMQETGKESSLYVTRQEVLEAEHQGHDKKYGNFSGVVHYNIKVVGSGKYLRQDVGDDAIIKAVSHDPKAELDAYARFRLVAETDGNFRIRNTATHHYMWEYLRDSQIRGTSSISDASTSFELEPQADFSYRIKVKEGGHYLHQDDDTGILTGGNVTNNMGKFELVALECCEKCMAYQIQPACPPDRCSWLGDGMPPQCGSLIHRGASPHHVLSAAVVAVVLAAFTTA